MSFRLVGSSTYYKSNCYLWFWILEHLKIWIQCRFKNFCIFILIGPWKDHGWYISSTCVHYFSSLIFIDLYRKIYYHFILLKLMLITDIPVFSRSCWTLQLGLDLLHELGPSSHEQLCPIGTVHDRVSSISVQWQKDTMFSQAISKTYGRDVAQKETKLYNTLTIVSWL